jgi:pimeloyl-ACP methyl ester carboxylesterase
VSLDAFGIPGDAADRAPDKLRSWLDALRDPPALAPYASLAAVADRLQKNNPRLPRDKAEFLAPHWAEPLPDGTARLRADAKHKLPFPTTSRLDDVFAIWRGIACPVLWVAAADSHIGKWLAPEGDAKAEIARRFAHLRHGRLETVADAGHMLHHDQPQVVARLVEAFAGESRR